MGSSLNKDQNLQVFMTLNNPVVYAGQALEGTVHIKCLKLSLYRYLNIIIDGREQCCWTQSRGDTDVTHRNSRNTYHAQVKLARFDLAIQRGDYNFPFSILLPRAIPASMKLDFLNYIKYEISAFIPAYDQHSDPQIYKRPLHIRQTPRSIAQIIRNQNVQTLNCCGCCCNCGSVALSLLSDVTYVDCDKIFHVKGAINNLNGQTNIKNYKVVLRQSVKKISKQDFSTTTHEDIVLYDANKPVPKGAKQSFQCQVKVPSQFVGYTAIGNIIYRTYYIAIVAEASCCISNPTLAAHTVVLNSSLPALQADQQRKPPLDWNPISPQPLAFMNISPYMYTPSALIDVRNQDGNVVSGMMEQMSSDSSMLVMRVK